MADLSKQLRTMKQILILLLALLPFVAKAQMTVDHDYKIVTWNKVYETDMTQDEILQHILAYGYLDDVVTHGNMIAGDIPPVLLNYESAGYSRMKVALYLSNDRFTGRIIIRFKEGRYMAEAVALRFGAMPLYEGYGEYAFDITAKLVTEHLERLTTFYPASQDW